MISRRTGTAASYYIYDGGLSVRALTNEAGTVTDTLVFDAFGNETVKTGSTDNSYGFQGEEKDETGLYYLRARYMDSSTGTFTSMDTYGGSLSDPMSLHKYMFANSNPVMYTDPSGHSSLTLGEAMGVCAIIGALSGALLYDLGFLRDENEPKSIGGYLTYVIVGAIIAVLIFLVIYFIAKLILFIIALVSTQPDKVEQAVEKIDELTEGARGGSGGSPYRYGEAFRSVTTGNGGKLWVSVREVYQEDVIELYNKLGDVKVKIISGIHGFDGQPGRWEPYAEALKMDQSYFGTDIVYDFLKIKDDADLVASLFNTDGDTILAWCFSQEIGENWLNRILYGF